MVVDGMVSKGGHGGLIRRGGRVGIIGIIGSLGTMGDRLVGLLAPSVGRVWAVGQKKCTICTLFLVLGVGWLYLCTRDLMRALPCLVSRLCNIIYKVYVRRACDDQIVLLTNQIEVIDHD